ncbi:MAG: TIGR01212 family radical SAM protein [Epsilonproteobacteria bacterium]|nr:TIGR01212 family radical SAM protein [Campylobacterota bacterium]NPA88963.1 TIGR01212 family radical SAM protein [Campylobacterota bacterium]
MKRIFKFGSYLKEKFGVKVKKVPISIPGFTCPNIDGKVSRGGCIFCENESFSPNFQKNRITINPDTKSNPLLIRQLEALESQFYKTTPILKRVYGAEKFLVYFQSFTNTYAPFETLKKLYLRALEFPNVVGLSIGTRTDSITPQTLQFLAELKEKGWEIWVEYGIQSSNNETLERINRGHTFENVVEWVEKTHQIGLPVCGHLIFGLPGEGKKEMIQSVKDSVALGIESFKFHPLYITRHTLLALEYLKGNYRPLDRWEYLEVLEEGLKLLPEGVSVQRITAGTENLLAPEWCRNKGEQMGFLVRQLRKRGIIF